MLVLGLSDFNRHAGYDANDSRVDHGHLGAPHAKAPLQAVKQVPDKGVDPLADTLEHDQSERDTQESVDHAEQLPSICAGGRMAVSCR